MISCLWVEANSVMNALSVLLFSGHGEFETGLLSSREVSLRMGSFSEQRLIMQPRLNVNETKLAYFRPGSYAAFLPCRMQLRQ